MQEALVRLGNPHQDLFYLHIAGTNGKGSVSASSSSILQAAGYKVGLFTSPHLFKYNERFKINGKDITDANFAKYYKKVEAAAKIHPKVSLTIFDVCTLMMFLYFKDQKVDIVVLETGLGGLFDATNVIEKSIAVITNIGFDHVDVLGKTKRAIAGQKAGILKPNSTLILGEQDPKLLSFFKKWTKSKKGKLTHLNVSQLKALKASPKGQWLHFKNHRNLFTPLLGQHQMGNTALAILACEELNRQGFKISNKAIREGLRKTTWPLRMEIVKGKPDILLDVGHNPHGVHAVSEAIKSYFPNRKKILILGCSKDKDYKRMVKELSHLSDSICVTQAKQSGVDPKTLSRYIPKKGKDILMFPTVAQALRSAKRQARPKDLIMVLGGLYLAAEAKKHLQSR